jgi:hypothetical protein
MSLDGFMTAAGITSAEPMGQGAKLLSALSSDDRAAPSPGAAYITRLASLVRQGMVNMVIPARAARRAGRAVG